MCTNRANTYTLRGRSTHSDLKPYFFKGTTALETDTLTQHDPLPIEPTHDPNKHTTAPRTNGSPSSRSGAAIACPEELRFGHRIFKLIYQCNHFSLDIQQANPADILLFHKRRQAESTKGGKAAARKKRGAAGLDVPMEPEDLENVNIEDLVTENLVNNDKKLELLDEKSMGEGMSGLQSGSKINVS